MHNLYNEQKPFYHIDKMGLGQYVILTGSVIIPRQIPVARLQEAANEVIRINDQLRVRFVEKDGDIYQEIKPYQKKEFEVKRFESRDALHKWCEGYGTIPMTLDWRSEGAGIPKAAWKPIKSSMILVINTLIHRMKMRRLIKKYGMTNREPGVFELILFELPDECGAVIKMHHIVSDAWCMMLVANQFLEILKGEHPAAYDFLELMSKTDNYETTKRYMKDVEFFEEQKKKCPDKTWLWPQNATTLEAKRRTKPISEELSRRIKEYSSAHGISPYVLFLTGVAVYMNRKLDRNMFYFGSVTSNRAGIMENNCVGLFIKQFALLLEIDQNVSFAETAARIRDKTFAGFRHYKGYHAPLDSANYPYDLWISYQNAVLDADTSAIVTQYYCNYTRDIAILSIEDRGGEGTFKLHFDQNLKIPDRDADELFDTVIGVLAEGIADDSKSIGSLYR